MEENPESAAMAADTEKLEQALEEERKRAENYLANWQRAQADFVNYKRWAAQEKEETARLANAGLMCAVLPVLDDLERALESTPPELRGSGWAEGIGAIVRKFQAIMERQGLAAISALGQPFDPNFHEALRNDAGPEGMVIAEIQKGYLLNGKLLRPARVIVGSGEGPEEKED